MGRWRLTPPWYGGICLPAGRSAGLTRHRRVIQYRGPIKGKAWGCIIQRREALKGKAWEVRRQERKTPAVAGASGRVSLRAGERRPSPFIRQR